MHKKFVQKKAARKFCAKTLQKILCSQKGCTKNLCKKKGCTKFLCSPKGCTKMLCKKNACVQAEGLHKTLCAKKAMCAGRRPAQIFLCKKKGCTKILCKKNAAQKFCANKIQHFVRKNKYICEYNAYLRGKCNDKKPHTQKMFKKR